MNPPFAIGQKVVCITHCPDGLLICGWDLVKDSIYEVNYIEFSNAYINNSENTWFVGLKNHGDILYNSRNFAPINHDDATSEILEKFKQTDEKPDVIKIKELI